MQYGKLGDPPWPSRLTLRARALQCYETYKGEALVVGMIFVGRIGPAELAAASLGSSLANVTGNSVMAGLGTALATFCGQAYGAKQYTAVGEWLQRALLILTLLCAPIVAAWMNAEAILLAIGQEPEVAQMTAVYIRGMIPGLVLNTWFACVQIYLQSQGIVNPIFFVCCLTAALHPFVTYILVYPLGVGYTGAAFAYSISCGIQLVGLLACVRILKLGEKTWGGWSRAALREWPAYMIIAGPSLLLISEWWASEVAVMMSGWLPDAQRVLSAMAIYQMLGSVCFLFPYGLAIGNSTRVANELGAGQPEQAKRSALVAALLGLTINLKISIILLIFRHKWGYLFTADAQTADVVALAATFLSLYQVFDGQQAVLSGCIRGAGKQAVAFPVVLVSYWLIGVPVAYFAAFKAGMGVAGLLTGTLTGTICHGTMFAVIALRMDWPAEAERAMQRVGAGVLPTLNGGSASVVVEDAEQQGLLSPVADSSIDPDNGKELGVELSDRQ